MRARLSWPPAAAATARLPSGASSRPIIRGPPGRSPRSRSTSAPRLAISTRFSTTRTAARGRRTCRGIRFRRRRAPTARRGVETPDGRPAVYLDTTRVPEADANVSLPYMLRRYRAGGVDPLKEPILTYPVLHYQNGGLVIDEQAETTLEGVFACGEIAGGTHGRNRMMGNSLLECTVFGRRAGRAAAEKARR